MVILVSETSLTRKFYKLDDYPGTGEFANMVAALEASGPEKRKEDLIIHLDDKHLKELRDRYQELVELMGTEVVESAIRQTQQAIQDAHDTDPADEQAMFQLELKYQAVTNEFDDKYKLALSQTNSA